MLTQALIYLPSIIGIVAVASLVIFRSKQLTYRLFSIFALFVAIWLVLQFFVDAQIPGGKLWLRLISATTGILAYFFLAFSVSYPKSQKISNRFAIFTSFPVIVLAALSFTPLLIKNVVYGPDGSNVSVGALYQVQNLILLLYIFVGLVMIASRYKKSNFKERRQISLLSIAFSIAVAGNILSGLVFTNSQIFQTFRPISIFIMVAIIAYAMIKHGLFDIRLVVARSLGYVTTIAVLASMYGIIVFGIARLVFDLHFSVIVQISLSAVTAIIGLTFENFWKRFNKLTNKIFYRDAYDPQELFDHLNRTLVSSLNLKFLLKQTSSIIVENLKSEFVFFGIKDNLSESYRIEGTNQPKHNGEDIAKVRSLTSKISQSVLIVDLLDEKHEDLKRILNRNNVAILVQLATNAHKKTEESLGFIALGPKKSGNPYNSQDVRVLDTVANELIIAIQNALHFEEIQRFNITLQAKVRDATRQLQRTNAKLEALDETKDDFISMASHQLRTPLTSVKGYLSMVLDGDAGKVNDTQRKMLTQAFVSSQRMVYLIADLLNVSRLKTGKFVIDSSPTDLSKLITEEVSQLVETAESREIKLTYTKPAKFPVLQLDETKIRQVIMNFVDNAIYYTPAGGHIDVQLIDKDSSIELRVVDDGIGVPSAEQHHLFTKFYRARNAQKARPDGTGLGLFMAKKVVMAQGGAIIFDSKEGKGSTFGFVFSKEKLQSVAPVTSPVKSKTPVVINK